MEVELFEVSEAETQIILAYRALGGRAQMIVTKLEGQMECKIDVQTVQFIAKNSKARYNTDKSHRKTMN